MLILCALLCAYISLDLFFHYVCTVTVGFNSSRYKVYTDYGQSSSVTIYLVASKARPHAFTVNLNIVDGSAMRKCEYLLCFLHCTLVTGFFFLLLYNRRVRLR